MKLKNLALSGAIAFGLLTAAAPAVPADDEDAPAPPSATCTAPTAPFPFTVPGSLLGSPVPISGTLTITGEHAQGAVCVGTFTVIAAGGAITTTGTFTAVHIGSKVFVQFTSPLAKGLLFFDSVSGLGWSAAKITSAAGCFLVFAAFQSTGGTFAILGTPLLIPIPCS
jgi:hypothetical protein